MTPPVVVPSNTLADLCDLALTAAERLGAGDPSDALVRSLRAAVAEIRVSAVPDPT